MHAPGSNIADAYAHRFDAGGLFVWPEPLEVRITATDVRELTAISDGAGGMYRAMTDA